MTGVQHITHTPRLYRTALSRVPTGFLNGISGTGRGRAAIALSSKRLSSIVEAQPQVKQQPCSRSTRSSLLAARSGLGSGATRTQTARDATPCSTVGASTIIQRIAGLTPGTRRGGRAYHVAASLGSSSGDCSQGESQAGYRRVARGHPSL